MCEIHTYNKGPADCQEEVMCTLKAMYMSEHLSKDMLKMRPGPRFLSTVTPCLIHLLVVAAP